MAPHPLDPDLEKFARVHVADYEVAHVLHWLTTPVGDLRMQQAVAASYLIRLRLLRDFLATKAADVVSHPRDVVAGHYFAGTWHLTPTPLTGPEVDAIDRWVAHLSLDRLDAPSIEGTWGGHDLGEWGRRILAGFITFVDALAVKHPERAAWFDPKADEVRAFLAAR
jgi:hypothetical protein